MARRLAPLLPLLLLAAALRFTGLSWGLRHRPQLDERFYVANVGHMLNRGDLDHGFYQYPGFFYYLLAPVLAFFDDPRLDPRAFLAARAVVASFGVVSVGLVYALGQRTCGTPAALTAAALLAVSPVEVRVSHEVRPDVVLETFVLLGMLGFRRVGLRARWDAVAGVALGAATAVKFSGALLVPSYVCRRLVCPGFRLSRLLLAGAVSLATFVVLSPYTFLRGTASLEGMDEQLSYHYVERAADQGLLGTALAYGRIAVDGLGLAGVLLAVAGIALGRRQWRDWLPFLIFPLVTVAAFSTATIHQERFLVPALGVLALLTGPAAQALYAWRPVVFALAAVLAVAGPVRESVGYVRDVSRPATRDVTADWIERNVASGRVVATLNAALGLDPKRFETLLVSGLSSRTRIQALNADLVVTGPAADRRVIAELTKLFVAEPETPYSGLRLRVLSPPDGIRPAYEPLRLEDGRLEASDRSDLLSALHDGNSASAWRTTREQQAGEWVQVEFAEPVLVGRVELWPGGDRSEAGEELQLLAASAPGGRLSVVNALPGRPPIEQQRLGEPSQVLLLGPVKLHTLRIAQTGRKPRPWAISELRIDRVVR